MLCDEPEDGATVEARKLADVLRDLGLAWHFLATQSSESLF